MKTYRLAGTELDVSRIVYGCMGLCESWDGTPYTAEEVKHAIALTETALAQGINFFDHADIYARGNSEAVFGEVLKAMPGVRERIVLQTKCGIRFAGTPAEDSPGRYDFSYEHIVQSVDGSLSRLGVEQIDLLLLHRPDPLMEPEEVARAFDAVRGAGKVRYFGVSNFSAAQVALLQEALDMPLVVNQLEISLLHHHLINEGVGINQTGYPYAATTGTLDYCRLHGLRVQAWTPVARGKIFDPPKDGPENAHAVSEAIAALARAKDTSKEAIALGWLLRHPAGIQPVVGTSTIARLIDACQADAVSMSREEWYTLFTAARGKAVP